MTRPWTEINSETDFVSKRQEFQDFAAAVADLILARRPADIPELLASRWMGN
ncbi:MAG: hypothetical protein R3F37_19270 [Candidatus Competibacteraceae bacterium]